MLLRNLSQSQDVKSYIRAYWNRSSSDYDKFHDYGSEEEKIAWKKTLANTLGKERLNVLDVGTGTGVIAILLAQLGHNVTGIDLSGKMLEKAKEKAKELGLKIKFDICDAENLYFEDESFDAVVCRYLLWTLPNPKRAIKEWVRVVKPGGKVVVIDGKWFDRSISSRLRRIMGNIGIVIYERRNPWKYYYKKEVSEKLPFRNGAEPEKVVELFRGSGLSNISVQELVEVGEAWRRNMPLLYRIGLDCPIFLVKGIKGEKMEVM